MLSCYLDPQRSIVGVQSSRLHNPMQASANLDEVCEAHLATLLGQQSYGSYYLLSCSLGGTLTQGVTTRLCARNEQVAFLGLLDTWPPETQNWQEKEANGLDPEVLVEINRRREAFLAAQQGSTSTELFTTTGGNYADTVRLLMITHSALFGGKATLLAAECTLQEGTAPEQAWAPWIVRLGIYRRDCAHVDIISPVAFGKIGPIVHATPNK